MMLVGLLLGALVAGQQANRQASSGPQADGPAQPATAPADNLEYWLGRAGAAQTRPAAATAPAEKENDARREDALPGVIELSDGRVLAGRLYTTRETPFQVYLASQKRWRRVPLIAALSVTAVVVEEKMAAKWRWKEMGVPERVYSGQAYPTRRLKWKFRLIDGSELTGAVKGQPLWLQQGGRKKGPFILHERSKGLTGQKLKDLIYVKRVIVSRRMMEKVLAEEKRRPATSPAKQ